MHFHHPGFDVIIVCATATYDTLKSDLSVPSVRDPPRNPIIWKLISNYVQMWLGSDLQKSNLMYFLLSRNQSVYKWDMPKSAFELALQTRPKCSLSNVQ